MKKYKYVDEKVFRKLVKDMTKEELIQTIMDLGEASCTAIIEGKTIITPIKAKKSRYIWLKITREEDEAFAKERNYDYH